MTQQVAVLMNPEMEAHERQKRENQERRSQLGAALASCQDAAERLEKVAAGWPDHWARGTIRNMVRDLDKIKARIENHVKKLE